MASTDARPIPQKNVAYRVTFPIYDADGDLVTGATGLDSEVSKDAGTFADCTNEATEIATSSGMYYLDLTSTEMNADTVAVIVKTSSSGAKTTVLVFYPEEAGDIRTNVTQVNGTNQTAGDLAALINTVDDFLDTEVAAIKAKTDNLPASPAATGDIPSAATIADAVWDEDATGHQTQGTFGQAIGDPVADTNTIFKAVVTDAAGATVGADSTAILEDTGTTLQAELDGIQADTEDIQTRLPAALVGGRIDATVDATGLEAGAAGVIADAVWDEDIVAAHNTADTAGKLLNDTEAAVDTEIAAIKAKTDLIPASPAAVGSAMTLTSGERTAIANEVEAQIIDDTDSEKVLTAITDKIASVNPSLDDLTLAGIASAVRTELTTELARMDAAVSSRLASGTVASDITAIKAKTDNLPADPADASDIAAEFSTVNTKLDAIDDFVDTEVSAVKSVTDKLNTAVELDGSVYRFTTNALEQAPSGGGGGGATAAEIADAVWDERLDDHLNDRSFGAKLAIHGMGGADIDYKKIEKMISAVSKRIDSIPQPEKVDLIPVSEGLQAVIAEIRSLPKPKDPEKADYTPILAKLDGITAQINEIEIPEPEEVDLTPVMEKLEDKSEIQAIVSEMSGILERIRTFFTADINEVKQGQQEMLDKLDSVQMVVLDKKEEKPKEKKTNVLEEYLKL